MRYDVVVVGGGLSGLTAASLLAKRGLSVAVVERASDPGGSCGAFRRGGVMFDQGAAMLYGFGEHGFNAHRFIFDCLEEPIDIIRHDLLYSVSFDGRRIRFWPDVDRFADELSEVFPSERDNIHRFYRDMSTMYHHVMVETPSYVTADETDGRTALKAMLHHPVSYIRFLSLLNRSAESLLRRYFSDPEIFKFFDKLTSTYCYTTVAESPAVLAAVMFVDNHVGGSFYPAGSTLFLPGKLEKVIEEHGGDMFFRREAVSLVFDGDRPVGVELDDGGVLHASDIVWSGTVWNLYGRFISPAHSTDRRRRWARLQQPTYPSVVLYSVVDRGVIPDGTDAIEMIVGNPDQLDESEVTAYVLSIDDRTLCGADEHTVVAIGPTFERWDIPDRDEYERRKLVEQERLITVLERRFPGFRGAVRFAEVATPKTIERYTMKNGGAVAGPKQMLGQHMLHRLHTRTEWDNLFCCGESTVMGTGTPTVSTAGLSAANAILVKAGREPYVYREGMESFVHIVDKPFTSDRLGQGHTPSEREVMRKAMHCRFCEHPTCTLDHDIRGIMRRVAVGNLFGARKCWLQDPVTAEELEMCESRCISAAEGNRPVEIRDIIAYLDKEAL